eukprot:m.110153 g.110153  ORF g.110153 m.110153 type:complete len:409 (-) comp14023_c0_seq5:1583-2809(-)
MHWNTRAFLVARVSCRNYHWCRKTLARTGGVQTSFLSTAAKTCADGASVMRFSATQFGKFYMETSTPITVRALDGSADCPYGVDDMNTAVILELHSKNETSDWEDQNVQNMVSTIRLPDMNNTENSEDKKQSLFLQAEHNAGGRLVAWLPPQMDVHVVAKSVNKTGQDDTKFIIVRHMISSVTIEATHENVEVGKSEGGIIEIETGSGDVHLNKVRGQLAVRTNQGNITGDRIVANNVSLESILGDIELEALYAEYADIETAQGHVFLGPTHGSVNIQTVGEPVLVATSVGILKVVTVSGDIDVYANDENELLDLETTRGKIDISLPEDCNKTVQLSSGEKVGSSIKLENMKMESRSSPLIHSILSGNIGEGGNLVVSHSAMGPVSLQEASWFQRNMQYAKKLASYKS